ncbi:hypothetical protein QYE76_007228 [Lolium multiflorum]|uniref:Retrotransposon gag domain-containing protein n=1 Tax=Lolium multiflorum TaxID=4521 RepID=A0AAD8W4X1_LOLMU|nr:hypothetical protein QYE76_007228 [Lolium multiflorum]
MDVKLDMELDMKISHGREREREACARGEEEVRAGPGPVDRRQPAANGGSTSEFEALRNEMRREFRAQDDELKGTVDEIKQTLDATNVTVTGLADQDEEDGLGKPKFSIPKFEGGADVEEYLTWELKIEKLWSLHPNYSEDKKIKLASSEFDGYALRWWDSLVRVKTVDEYYMEMEMLMQRGRVRESLEMTMQCFLNGLNWLKKQMLRDVLRELGVLHPRTLYSAGAFDALRSLLYYV